jgi:hypothetical protein
LCGAHRLNDEGEVDERREDDIELLEAGEDAAEPFQATEQPLDLVATAVQDPVVAPGLDPPASGRSG